MPTPTTTTLPLASACCAPLGAPSLSDDQAEAMARLFRALAAYYSLRPDALAGLAAALDLQGASR
jgi:hypothetical protein